MSRGGDDGSLEMSDEIPIERSAGLDRGGDSYGETRRTAAEGSSSSQSWSSSPSERTPRQRGNRNDEYFRSARRAASPYLPPPLVRAVDRAVDPYLLRTLGVEEGTAKLVATALLAYLVLRVARRLASMSRRGGRAVMDDAKDERGSSALLGRGEDGEEYSCTVLICGPPLSGKTRLFYHLLYDKNYDTVSSLEANAAVAGGARYVDWPGARKVRGPAGLGPVLRSPNLRVAVVADSTQPVAGAADVLHQLFSHYHGSSLKSKSSSADPVPVLVMCHKSDLPGAKNAKRIQLQLRGELERLLKSSSAKSAASSAATAAPPSAHSDFVEWWPVGEPLDFDRLGFARVSFASTSCEGEGCRGLLGEFCRTGELPPKAKPGTTAAAAT
jgi:signal recognition particle receptor subunit beta